MIGKSIQPEIKSLVEARNFTTLRDLFEDWSPVEVAEVISDIPEQEQAVVFRLLHKDIAAETFEYLDLDTQKSLIKAMGKEQVAAILNDMSPDDRTALLEELPGAAVKTLISLLSPDERKVAQSLLGYPENSVGRLMTPYYIAIKKDWTVQHVLDFVRQNGQDSETLNVLYVIDDHGKLLDDIRIREFLLAPVGKKVEDLMNENFVSLAVTDDQSNAVEAFKKYDRIALPVADSSGILVGIVTVDDVIDVAEEEATEDIQKLGGLEALDEPYMTISLFNMVRKRGTWLVILFLSEMLTATAMGYFQAEIEKAVVLVLFIPLIMSSGGNSGSQATSLVIRALALTEVSLADWWRVMRREIISGFLLGALLGAIGFLRISVWEWTGIQSYGDHWILVALTVGFSLIGVVMWGTLSGSMLPFILKRLGFDPATSSAPFVATLVDVTGLVIYFTVASAILLGTVSHENKAEEDKALSVATNVITLRNPDAAKDAVKDGALRYTENRRDTLATLVQLGKAAEKVITSQIVMDGNTAYVTCKTKSAANPQDSTMHTSTLVLEKDEKAWKVTHWFLN